MPEEDAVALKQYGIVTSLDKAEMTPKELLMRVKEAMRG